MEKAISQEERLRRAEEIYQRRKMANRSGVRVASSSVNNTKTRLSLFKKMALQLAICAVIYIIFYLIKNTNYIFSQDVIGKTKELLSYDINFGNVYTQVNSFIENNKDRLKILGITPEGDDTSGNNEAEQNGEQQDEQSKKTQMELDAEYIKQKCSFTIPLKGTVTSRYGEREKTSIISANHIGIDIGASLGSAIYASMEGTVTVVSSEGEYRKTY